jgi:RNA polymerase primary sigma factor
MSSDALGDYLANIGRVPLLTAAEELHLSGIVQQWLQDPEPSGGLERRGRRAKNRMVQANLRLVVALTRRYGHLISANDTLDLIQAGNLGLVRAVEKFDPTRGYKFSTYAFWWIKQGITKYLNESNRMIRLPGTDIDKLLRIAAISAKLSASSGKTPTRNEIAVELGITGYELGQLINRAGQCKSLDALVTEDGGSLAELIPTPEAAEDSEESSMLQKQLEKLKPIYADVLKLRHIEGLTYGEVGSVVGIEARRARRICETACQLLARMVRGLEEQSATGSVIEVESQPELFDIMQVDCDVGKQKRPRRIKQADNTNQPSIL